MSLQMRRLEEVVGAPPPFERLGRRKVLTVRGERPLAHAGAMLRVERSMVHVLGEADRADPVRLDASDDDDPLPPTIASCFASESPGVVTELHCQTGGSPIEMVARGRSISRSSPGCLTRHLAVEELADVIRACLVPARRGRVSAS